MTIRSLYFARVVSKFEYKRVGGITFVSLGRLRLTLCRKGY